jgi:predicted nucleotidyltransferase
VDRLGVFVAATRAMLGLSTPPETLVSAGPDQDTDVALHEVGKFVRLAAVCNPSVLELLFLPE